MTDINPELIAKAADVLDVRRHDYRVDTDTWVPYCACGWSAEESYDVAAYDRHLAGAVLEAVADDLRAEGRREVFDALRMFRDEADKPLAVDLGTMVRAWLDEREGLT